MPFSPTDSKIYAPLFSDPTLAEIFSDEQFVRRLVEVEVALAEVQAALAVIPTAAAAQIRAAAASFEPDYEALAAGTERAGLPMMALLAQLRAHVGAAAAGYVHWGATTQDIMDTAVVLQCRAALAHLEQKLMATIKGLAALADAHRSTLMAGRTHAQQALPLPFGFKVAGWLAPLLRHRERLAQLRPRLLVVQFGGAAGTLASLGERGTAVQAGLAEALGLGVPLLPWHTGRDALAELGSWLSLVTGSLGKMGQDIILLSQSEVAEVRETADFERGGSSTMPQKSNPVVSEVMVAAARTNAALLAALHGALVQEHERATHGWQVEWLSLPQMFGLTAAALNKGDFLAQNLVVDAARMERNVAASRGLMLAEAISFALAEVMGRAEAKRLVRTAVQTALAEERHLVDVVRGLTDLPINWEGLRDEAAYFGAAQRFIDQVVAAAEAM